MPLESQNSAPTVLDLGRGQPLRVTRLNDSTSFAAMPWQQLVTIVPDPRMAEDQKVLQVISPVDRAQAEMRNEVQRMIHRTKKAENAQEYARYIASGLRGTLGSGWATPPFALWIPERLSHVSQQGPFGEDVLAYLPIGVRGVLVDAETQHLAHMLIAENPQKYGLSVDAVNNRVVGVEIYHGISMSDARQIFHDRNLLGVIPNKTVALNSDSRDVATSIAGVVMDRIHVIHPTTKVEVPLRVLVSVNKRQLGARDEEWMTLSTLRSFIVTLLYGRPGFEMTSAAISPDAMPARHDGSPISIDEATAEVLSIAEVIFGSLSREFARRTETVVAAPAVLGALGAVAHRSTSWSPEPRRSHAELAALLRDVNWDRDPTAWSGVAGKVTPSGQLSLAGGVKDNGSKTATALEDPGSVGFQQIRRGRS